VGREWGGPVPEGRGREACKYPSEGSLLLNRDFTQFAHVRGGKSVYFCVSAVSQGDFHSKLPLSRDPICSCGLPWSPPVSLYRAVFVHGELWDSLPCTIGSPTVAAGRGGCGPWNGLYRAVSVRRLTVKRTHGGCGPGNSLHCAGSVRCLTVKRTHGGCGPWNGLHRAGSVRRLAVKRTPPCTIG